MLYFVLFLYMIFPDFRLLTCAIDHKIYLRKVTACITVTLTIVVNSVVKMNLVRAIK